MKIEKFAENQFVFRQHDRGDKIYMILEGKVKVLTKRPAEEIVNYLQHLEKKEITKKRNKRIQIVIEKETTQEFKSIIFLSPNRNIH